MSAVEHTSVLTGGRFLAESISKVGVTRSGVVDLEHLRDLLASGPVALVSIMAANNETGALQPVAQAAEMVHAAGGLLHVDAIQAFGKIPLNIKDIGADLLSLSAHKIGGPKGVGALVLAEGVAGLEPLLRGGGQELSRRAGTENVAGVAGFGVAVGAALDTFKADAIRLENLGNRLERFPACGPKPPSSGSIWLISRCPQAPPARRARSSRPTCWKPWDSVQNSPKAVCASVWAGPRHRQTSIAAWRLGESSPVAYLKGATKHCLNGSKQVIFSTERRRRLLEYVHRGP